MQKPNLPQLAMSLFREGVELYEKREFKQAEKVFNQVSMLLPESEEVLYNLALVYAEQKKLGKARELVHQIEHVDCTALNELLDQYETEPLPIDKYCRQCQNFEVANNVCSTLHFNVKDYPEKFEKQCGGKLFDPIQEMASETIDEAGDIDRPDEEFDEYTEILSTFNLGDIAVIKSLLDPTEIDYMLENEQFHNVSPLIHPVRLLVKKEQVEVVKELLQDVDLNFFFIKTR